MNLMDRFWCPQRAQMIVYLAAIAVSKFQERLFEWDDAHEKALTQLGAFCSAQFVHRLAFLVAS